MTQDNWPRKRIDDVVDRIIDYRGKTPKKTTKGIPLITAKIVKNGFIQPPQEFIAEKDYESWMVRGLPRKGDVLLTMEAPLGEVAQIKTERVALAQRLVAIRGKEGLLDNTFLKYLLLSDYGQSALRQKESGTTVIGIKQSELRKVEIPVPPLPEQRAIADVLSALDDKIELNRRMNRTLEQLAQTLFKRWFINNPESENWEPHTLGDLISINKLKLTQDYKLENIEYIDISSVSTGNLDSTSPYDVKNAPSRAKRLVSHGDTIWSTVRPNRKSYLYISNPKENVVVSTGFVVLTPEKIPPSYLYSFVTTDFFIDYLISNADGSAYPAVLPIVFARAEILLPPDDLLTEFHQLVDPVREKIALNDIENKVLNELRDTLLPKLMSGQVRVIK